MFFLIASAFLQSSVPPNVYCDYLDADDYGWRDCEQIGEPQMLFGAKVSPSPFFQTNIVHTLAIAQTPQGWELRVRGQTSDDSETESNVYIRRAAIKLTDEDVEPLLKKIKTGRFDRLPSLPDNAPEYEASEDSDYSVLIKYGSHPVIKTTRTGCHEPLLMNEYIAELRSFAEKVDPSLAPYLAEFHNTPC